MTEVDADHQASSSTANSREETQIEPPYGNSVPCPLASRVGMWDKRRIVPQASGLPEYQIKHHQIGETNRYWSSRTNPRETAATVISIPLSAFQADR